jgi:hypothetical protein
MKHPCIVLLPPEPQKLGADEATALQGGRAKNALLAVADGETVNTADAAYATLIAPAIRAAGLEPLRPTGPLAELMFNEARLAQLLDDFPDDIQRLKTDVFRARVRYAEDVKAKLAAARRAGADAVAAVETELGDIGQANAAVVIDLLLSYRAVSAWSAMIALVARMAAPLAATVLVREQWAFALNRAGRGEEAEALLLKLIAERGASSETCGILGRVYKDRWQAARDAGDAALARGLLDLAIGAYLQGFEADWRDAYPGVNAVTLMELKDTPDPRQAALLPVVRYAVERRVAGGAADYWDYATRLELAVLARDRAGAAAALADALAHLREGWEAASTARNLALIAAARRARGDADDWLAGIAAALERAAADRENSAPVAR